MMNSGNICKNEMEEKSKVDLDNLKSDYFLKEMFNIMQKKKSLKIMKYSKKLQKKLNLSIKDYKELLCSSIEIELKLVDDNNIHGKFINIPDKEKKYYHIYFDNSNEEKNRNYLNKNEKVNTIKIIIDYQVKSFEGLFEECKCLS